MPFSFARRQSGLERQPAVWRSRASLLVALLGLTFVLAAVLAYEAHDAARSHRVTAERALRDYATFAAWELLANATDTVGPTLSAALAPVTAGVAATPYDALPGPSVLAASAGAALRCADRQDDSSRWYFRLDFRDGSFTTSGATPPAQERALVRSTVDEQARTVYRPDWSYATVLAGRGATERAVAYAVKYAVHGAPIAAFGFSTCANALGAPVFAGVMGRHPLLPRTLAMREPNDSLVSVTVFGPAGDTIWQSGRRSQTPFTADASQETFGGLTARATLRPLAVERLALGAIPQSKVSLLLGLLALTAGMMVLAVLQLRREQELARLRSDFISSVSHELRTPLAQILLFAETLRLGRVRSAAERIGATDVIVQEARRLMQLVENVLLFSRSERRMTRLNPVPTPLAPCVRETVDAWRPLAAAGDATLCTDLDEHAVALIDRGAVRQLLLNLLDNAIKYGPAGQTVTVTVDRRGGRARLMVCDQGPGVPLGERHRVWQPFQRLERDVHSAAAGSGIGLYVVRELAAMQHGDVWIEDAPQGGGACFGVAFPLVERGGHDAPVDDAATAVRR
ncbi:MAG TPA: HAMP domain-containing sensor histidine kinase [Gemmatimonadaceae bacterium]|nr:HAMP domain-containing sensor histidine kinase [Gemmatimonadaceae bacterium]